MTRTGVVAALAAEARTLGNFTTRSSGLHETESGLLLALGGMGAARAASAARALLEGGATRLVSWGMAGGLDPTLRAGTVCLPERILSGEGRGFSTDETWRIGIRTRIEGRLPIAQGTMLTVNRAIDSPADKAVAFHLSGALCVDMESVAVAEQAAAHAVPFVAVRVIVDTAGDSLPAPVMAASRGDRVDGLLLLRGLLRRPQALGALLRLGQRYRRARRSLMAVARSGALGSGTFGTGALK